jgi:hypothetical protein
MWSLSIFYVKDVKLLSDIISNLQIFCKKNHILGYVFTGYVQ